MLAMNTFAGMPDGHKSMNDFIVNADSGIADAVLVNTSAVCTVECNERQVIAYAALDKVTSSTDTHTDVVAGTSSGIVDGTKTLKDNAMITAGADYVLGLYRM